MAENAEKFCHHITDQRSKHWSMWNISKKKQKKFLEICIIFMKRDHKIKPAKLEIRLSVTKFYHHDSVGDLCSENQKCLLLKPVFLFLRNNASIGKG